MEVYVNDILVKFLQTEQHIKHLDQTFQVLSKYKMRLNLAKCVFCVASKNFMGFMVHNRGIEGNPEKIQALFEMISQPRYKIFND